MDASLCPRTRHADKDDEEEEKEHLSDSASSSSDVSIDSAASSSSSDLTEDASSLPTCDGDAIKMGPLHQMSSLMEQLPFKRGLSKHFQGKSQSFTSLSNVRCLKDLAKPDNPYKRKLKSCRSYGGGLDIHTPKASSRTISKKASKGSCASLISKRNSFLGNKPPVPPHRASNQTPLFV